MTCYYVDILYERRPEGVSTKLKQKGKIMDNEMDWSEEETNYEESNNFDVDNCQTNKSLSVYEDLKLAAKNIGDKLVPYKSDSGFDRLNKKTKREIALKNKVDYILNNCEKFGFNQTNKIILENAINEVIKPKTTVKLLNLKKDIKKIKYNWVSKGLGLAAGDSIILVAEPFCGKTHFASYLAVCISTGTPIFGKFAIDRKGEVAHLNYDSSDDLTEVGYIRMVNGLKGKINEDDVKIHYERPLWKFNEDVAYENLTKACVGKVVCIIDSLRTCYDGVEDSSETATYIALANRVSNETGCAILFIAHPGKGGIGNKGIDAVRGSSAMVAAAGTLWTLETTSVDQVIKFNSTHKSRFGSKQIFHYRYDNVGDYCENINATESIDMTIPGDDSALAIEKKVTIREQIVAALKNGPLTSKDLNDKVAGNHASKYDEYKKMETEGFLKIEQEGKSRMYSLTDSGAWL